MSKPHALHVHGCVLLRGVFASGFVDALQCEFAARYGSFNLARMRKQAARPQPNPVAEVGGGRFEIVLWMNGAFGSPDLFANKLLCGFLGRLLGAEMRLTGLTAIASYPGATAQCMHRDHAHLFAEFNIGPGLPVYAVNVSVPLIDVDLATGPTGIWLGSHRWSENTTPEFANMTAMPFERGDCILIDYRTGHAGLPNQGAWVRPILYMVYARPRFFDEANHPGRWPLDMSLAEFRVLPESTRMLLLRVYSQAMRLRQLTSGHA